MDIHSFIGSLLQKVGIKESNSGITIVIPLKDIMSLLRMLYQQILNLNLIMRKLLLVIENIQ